MVLEHAEFNVSLLNCKRRQKPHSRQTYWVAGLLLSFSPLPKSEDPTDCSHSSHTNLPFSSNRRTQGHR